MEVRVLKAEGKKSFGDRGDIFTIPLEDNDLPRYRAGIKDRLLNSIVEIEGSLYTVTGIEMSAVHDSVAHNKIGILCIKLDLDTWI